LISEYTRLREIPTIMLVMKLVVAAATTPYSATAPDAPIESQAGHSSGICPGKAFVSSGVGNSPVSGSEK
jgi:hypothetical protein